MERLQKTADLACIPVIVLTCRDPQANKERALRAGARAFFHKPVDNEELLAAIRMVLENPVPQTTPTAR
jgi:DNA-binding response OmpR family regulator